MFVPSLTMNDISIIHIIEQTNITCIYNLEDFHRSCKKSGKDENDVTTETRITTKFLNRINRADPATIKKAYRKLAKKYHPDSNVGNEAAAENLRKLMKLYDILPIRKEAKLYDQFGHAADGTRSSMSR